MEASIPLFTPQMTLTFRVESRVGDYIEFSYMGANGPSTWSNYPLPFKAHWQKVRREVVQLRLNPAFCHGMPILQIASYLLYHIARFIFCFLIFYY